MVDIKRFGVSHADAGDTRLLTELIARLEHAVHPLVAGATERYRLADLGRAAFHDWGGVHVDFHELVCIDRPAKTLSLLVAADD
ncbi:hypothetical protein [Nonomuraea sp. NPDC050643]|uniref:hypothetical protein n=1 Tax=Nonomuraea sp. NPDC050643 TaxID=3155660 RepID=UPI0033F2E881